MRLARGFLCVLLVLTRAQSGFGYPTSVVFAPNGHVLEAGSAALAVVGVTPTSANPAGLASAQLGVESGVLGSARVLSLELGADALLRDAPETARVTAIFNAKLGLFEEQGYRPALSAGIFQVSVEQEANAALAYLAASKQLGSRGSLGELTVGTMYSSARAARSNHCQDACAFRGSVPFEDQRVGILLGWASPEVGVFGFSSDLLTGTSLVSGANELVTLRVLPELQLFAGFTVAVDRRPDVSPTDAAFAGISASLPLLATAPP